MIGFQIPLPYRIHQYGIGADTSGGVNAYFHGTPIGTDEGYTFYSKTKLIKSNHN